MTWVAHGVAARLRQEHGSYAAEDWQALATRLGLRWLYADLPDWLPAYRIDTLIVFRRGMDCVTTAWWAWHEIGHWLMHPGNILAPLGEPNVLKQECQANDFALGFPVWDDRIVVSEMR